MFNLNLVQITGLVTAEPEYRILPGGLEMAKFSIAVSANKKDSNDQWQNVKSFFDVTAWKKVAFIVRDYVKKGMPVYISGKLRHETWKDKETGKSMSKVSITANEVQIMSSDDAPSNQSREETRGPAPTSIEKIFPPSTTLIPFFPVPQPEPIKVTYTNGGWEPPLEGEPPF